MTAAWAGRSDGGPAHEAPCPVAPARALGSQEVMMIEWLGALPLAVTVSIVRDSAGCAQPRAGENDHGTVLEETPYRITGRVNFYCEFGHGVFGFVRAHHAKSRAAASRALLPGGR